MTSRRDSRGAIREHALQLFLRHGYEGTSLAEIATACGMTRPAVLYHFGSKEALLDAVVSPALVAIREALGIFQVVDRPTLRQQEILVRAMLEAMLAHRDEVALLGRFSSDTALCGLGPTLGDINRSAALALGGPPAMEDPHVRVRVAAAIACLSGMSGSRMPVPLATADEQEVLVAAILRLLDPGT